MNENFINQLNIYDGRWAINSNKSDNLMRFYIFGGASHKRVSIYGVTDALCMN